MLVVADSSPIIALINIGCVDVLPEIFERVAIPPQVAAELGDLKRPGEVRDFVAQLPAWLSIHVLRALEAIPGLHLAECEAINLASELRADLLLIDERDGRRAAGVRKLAFTGTIGVLERAATHGLIDLKDAFDRLKETDFWVSPKLLDLRLQKYLEGEVQ